MDKKSLPNGFITVDEAVELIKSNTFDKPTVNIKYMASRIDFVELNHNFAIPKVRLITKEEYAEKLKRYPGRRPSELVDEGKANITLRSNFEVELIKKAIYDNYKEVSGREYDPKHTRGVTTVIDQEAGGSEAPRSTKRTIAKEGETISSGKVNTTNSDDSAGV